MPLSTAQIAALKAELQADPAGLGYATPYGLGDDAGVARILNTVQPGVAYSIFKNAIPLRDMVANVASAEFTTLTATQLAQLQFLFLGASSVDASDLNTRNIITAIFAGKTATLTNFATLAKRQGSRAEVLFGIGVSVSDSDVSRTRASA